MEAVIASLDTLWFAYPAFIVLVVFIIRFVSGLTFRQLAKEIFASGQASLVSEGYEIDDELECSRLIDEYFTELDQDRQIEARWEAEDVRREYLLSAGYGEAGDW